MIRYDKTLTLAGLNQLFNNEILILCISHYLQLDNLSDILLKIENEEKSSYHYQTNKVSHIGQSSYEIDTDPSRYQHYYANVNKNMNRLHELFAPSPSPIEMLNHDFMRLWRPGLKIDSFHQKKMFAGVIRIIHQGSAIHAHQDHIKWSNPKADNTDDMMGQYGINYFLKTPKESGALMMWNKEYAKEDFFSLSKQDFCIPIENLPKPDCLLKPEVGMLTILNARKLHAIDYCRDSERIALSCFLAYRGQNKPLSIWS